MNEIETSAREAAAEIAGIYGMVRQVDALTAIILAHVKPAWLPIESAPKDGTWVFVCNTQNNQLWMANWIDSLDCFSGQARFGHPTLWQPLPPLPDPPKGVTNEHL